MTDDFRNLQGMRPIMTKKKLHIPGLSLPHLLFLP